MNQSGGTLEITLTASLIIVQKKRIDIVKVPAEGGRGVKYFRDVGLNDEFMGGRSGGKG